MENLAPAGNREALVRADAAGADAVYLGYAAFSARTGAVNFDRRELEEAIRYAHLRHIRVHVTVNTLVKDGELDDVAEVLQLLRDLHADAVLVQDLGVLRMIRDRFPELTVHASTQMAIHNRTGVSWCKRQGITRTVLARECSLEEIRRCVETGMEIEVFGHGAQCVAVSGECLFSSMTGERSGNRGRCAQPCRKMYRFAGQEGAWLSPRDLCLRDRIPELADAGVASLKIEGRLKRPEYVYTVTDSYRRALDSREACAFHPAGEAEQEALMQIFHRGGFMEGYAFGTEDAGVIQRFGVNHQGIRIGRVTECRGNLAKISTERDLHDGDGLRLKHGGREAEMTYAGKDTPAGGTAVLRLREGLRAEKGDEVYRLTDQRQLSEAMAAPLRKVSADLILEAWPGREIRLEVSDGENTAEVNGEKVSAARTRETTGEEMEKQLRKTGGTDFEIRKVQVRTAGAFVPVSLINGLRRDALNRLAELRADRFAPEAGAEDGRAPETAQGAAVAEEKTKERENGRLRAEMPEVLITVRTPEQAEACREGEESLIWYPEDFREEALRSLTERMRQGDWLRLPEVCEEETLQRLLRLAERYRDWLGGILLGSVGQLGLSWPVPVAAGPGIPVMNREAARLLGEEGCLYVTASPELTGEELKTLLAPAADLPPIVVSVYGRTQLMLLHHCPARTALGRKRGHAACALCDEGAPEALRGKELEDEKGYCFPLQRIRLPEGCLIRLLNTLPTDLGDRRIPAPRAAEMSTETAGEARETVKALRGNEKAPGERTRGHWNRPVE